MHPIIFSLFKLFLFLSLHTKDGLVDKWLATFLSPNLGRPPKITHLPPPPSLCSSLLSSMVFFLLSPGFFFFPFFVPRAKKQKRKERKRYISRFQYMIQISKRQLRSILFFIFLSWFLAFNRQFLPPLPSPPVASSRLWRPAPRRRISMPGGGKGVVHISGGRGGRDGFHSCTH